MPLRAILNALRSQMRNSACANMNGASANSSRHPDPYICKHPQMRKGDESHMQKFRKLQAAQLSSCALAIVVLQFVSTCATSARRLP
eukprot:6191514-Pleurochrysis_carterae.AAC.1